MKIFLSTDIEGVAGIVDWQQVLGPSALYEAGRRLLLNEINAAIDGAAEAGADEFVVNDSHWTMHNLSASDLHGGASYIAGWHKPLYMMEGLDGSFHAVFFVSYHGSMGASKAVLSHTYNPNAIWEVRLNDVPVGESAINSLVALHHRVPVALITGDQATQDEARPFMRDFEAVIVKKSITRHAAENLHPADACALIQEKAAAAVRKIPQLEPPRVDLPARLDVVFMTADFAEAAGWIGGVERTGARTVRIESPDPLTIYQRFVMAGLVVRALVEGR